MEKDQKETVMWRVVDVYDDGFFAVCDDLEGDYPFSIVPEEDRYLIQPGAMFELEISIRFSKEKWTKEEMDKFDEIREGLKSLIND